MTPIHFDPIYLSLLYQITNSPSLENNNNKITEYLCNLRDIFDYDNAVNNKILEKIRNLPKPTRICDVTVFEAKNMKSEGTQGYFVTVKFKSVDDEIQLTQISDKMVWNETLSLILDEATMNDRLVVKIRKVNGSVKKKIVGRVTATSNSTNDSIEAAAKQSSYVIGKAVIPMKDITLSFPFEWPIIGRKIFCFHQSFVKLKVNYTIHENKHFYSDSSIEYSVIYEKLLRYELRESRVTAFWWNGKFTTGQNLLDYYCESRKLPKSISRLAQWQVICQIQSSHPLAFSLFHHIIDDLSTFIRTEAYTETELSVFWDATVKFLEHSVMYLKNFNFDNEKLAIDLLKTLQKISSVISLHKSSASNVNLFSKKPNSQFDKKARNSIEPLISEVLKENAETWYKLNEINEDYTIKNLTEEEIGKKEIENLTVKAKTKIKLGWRSDDKEIAASDQLKLFYLKLKEFIDIIDLAGSKGILKNFKFNDWFDDKVFVNWFKNIGNTTKIRIAEAVFHDDRKYEIDDGMNYTSSALDTRDLLYVFVEQFKTILPTDKGKAFITAAYVVMEFEIAYSIYFEEISKTMDICWIQTEIDSAMINQFTLIVNNLEYLWSKIRNLIEELFVMILDPDDSMIINKKFPGLDNIQSNMNNYLSITIKNFVSNEISIHLQKLLTNGFTRIGKDVKPFELGSLLSTESFDKLFNFVWNEILLLLKVWMEKQKKIQQNISAMINFKNFFECLKEIFKGAVTNEELQEDLKFLNNEFQKINCNVLAQCDTNNFGILTFSCDFSENNLNFHVLNGRNLVFKTESEPNTFVTIELKHNNRRLMCMKTKIIKKSGFPLYEESFNV
uniref:CSON007876 protein n=1 Tax=Culicoides sonorensis TaxID=179676 RepID=A0A336MVE7_CULSO